VCTVLHPKLTNDKKIGNALKQVLDTHTLDDSMIYYDGKH
jgi:hypothetical protein